MIDQGPLFIFVYCSAFERSARVRRTAAGVYLCPCGDLLRWLVW